MNNNSYRLLGWAALSGYQYFTVIYGTESNRPNLVYMGVAVTWAHILGAVFLTAVWKGVTESYASKREQMALGNSPTPWVLDAVLDTAFAFYLMGNGWPFVGVMYLLHVPMVMTLRAKAEKFNCGLVQMVGAAESKLPKLNEEV